MSEVRYRILVVDDEESMRDVLAILLQREGYEVEEAADGAQAVRMLKEQSYDLVITDIKMPQLGGHELLAYIKERFAETLVIMITAFSTTEEAVEAMKQGAYDYIVKPFKNEEIRLIVRNALERKALRQENQALKQQLGQVYSYGNMIGKSKSMQQVFELIRKVADSRVNVLVCGESGTGKELVAKAIHYNSERKDHAFVAINCGAIPENLIESELFGHEKGSFTGAVQQKPGLFEVASGGTLFLDEIAELPPMMQVKLLRVLQERELRRLGGTRNISVDVRVIAATNKSLDTEVAAGRFREDLFYRLNVIRIDIPPLRERREDIPLLVDHFHQKIGGVPAAVSSAAMTRLLDYAWPGNVRELENVVERCLVLGQGGELTPSCLPPMLLAGGEPAKGLAPEIPPEGLDLDAYLGQIEKEILLKALEKSAGVRKNAANLLGITFRSIRYRLAKYGLGDDSDEEGEP